MDKNSMLLYSNYHLIMLKPETTGRLLFKALPKLHKRKVSPVVVTVVDNFPKKYQKHTSYKDAFRYLR